MEKYLPIVVAVPSEQRDRIKRSEVLPQHFLREINSEQLWEQNPAPSIYLWPYDIPYSQTERLRKIVENRVGDVPAFFGMPQDDKREAKDHQVRLVSRLLFDSVVVHVLFLDNRETDTTPGVNERNETYARFSTTFSEIIQWSHNLKEVLNIRFPNSKTSSRHILILISCEEQVTATQKEIDDLKQLIGKNKTFQACYFLDLNLKPEAGSAVFHSQYIWDVLVGRFLLALLLSQEKNDDARKPLWEYAGVKVWRASDCVFSLPPDSSHALKDKMGEAVSKLKELITQTEDEIESDPLQDALEPHDKFDDTLCPKWVKETPDYDEWKTQDAASANSFWRKWSDLPVSSYAEQIKTPEHWQESFDRLRASRIAWSKRHLPKDYTPPVQHFFESVRWQPGQLWDFIDRFWSRLKPAQEPEGNDHSDAWREIAAAEKERREKIRKLTEDSRDFQKAQHHYAGRQAAVWVMAAVTGFTGWMIWQVLSLFGVGILKILLLSGMVFAGSAAACILVILLHNSAGNRAAGAIMAECEEADEKMKRRDELVRRMFFAGIKKRDTLALRSVRFKTRRLAERIRFILDTELQPKLGSLLETEEEIDLQPKPLDLPNPDHVRDAYFEYTRKSIGRLQMEISGLEDGFFEKYLEKETENAPKSFWTLWKRLCAEDSLEAGYFPSRMFISEIRSFVTDFLNDTYHQIVTKSIQDSKKKLEDDFKKFTKEVHTMKDGPLLSASLSKCSGNQRRILFINAPLFDFRFQGQDAKLEKMREYQSRLLETTHTAALFYQEFDAEFALINQKSGSRAKDTDSQVLTFKAVPKGDA